MSPVNHHLQMQLTRRRLVCMILLGIWLFCVNVTTAHSQEHVLANDITCQLCLTSLNHVPIMIGNDFSIAVVIQSSFVEPTPCCFIDLAHPLKMGNRDPPYC